MDDAEQPLVAVQASLEEEEEEMVEAVRAPPTYAEYKSEMELFAVFGLDLLRHCWRGLDTNLGERLVSREEADYLKARGIEGGHVRNFIAWRRSSLVVSLWTMWISLFLGVYNSFTTALDLIHMAKANPNTTDGVNDTATFVEYQTLGSVLWLIWLIDAVSLIFFFLAIILTIFGLHKWAKFRTSRRLVFIGWCLYFFSTFILSFVPYRYFIPKPDKLSEMLVYFGLPAGTDPATVYGLILGGWFFLQLAPPSFTLNIAVLRSCLNVRTLVPQHPFPGYVVALVPFIFAPITWTAFVIIGQTVGNLFGYSALLIFTVAPFIFVIFRRRIVEPYTGEVAHKYAIRLRWTYVIVVLISMVLLVIWMIMLITSLDSNLKKIIRSFLSTLQIIELAMSFIAEYFFTNVFVADVIVSIIGNMRTKELQFFGAPERRTDDEKAMRRDYESRMDQLAHITTGRPITKGE